ncbi:hypothetical protein [Treponema sp. UBA3813]|uniref:hypothetical protein n=1 Tax=Treponema sp. UBA3813 TaxID=1947715 RepID=UPI0026003798|nr:hypothetical protein [Treponema sp. UBA3813]
MYHYAGNNPVRYIDPDGRNSKDTKKLNENIQKILDGVEKWTPGTFVPRHYNKGVLSKETYDFLGGINSEKGRPDFWFACAGGAICFRNTWVSPKLNPNPYSIARDLAKSGKINFYKDEKGNRITDPKVLGPMLKPGDVISFISDNPNDQWHTATVLSNDPEKEELIYMEYHGVGESERVEVWKITKYEFTRYSDETLYGGGGWQ